MNPFLAAATTICLIAGVLVLAAGLKPVPLTGRPPTRTLPHPIAALLGERLPSPARRRRRILLAVSVAAGAAVWLFSGWLLALVLVPAAALGLPALLRPPASATDVKKLSAIEQWTRGMSGVLTVGSGIEHAIIASLGSAPEAIRPQVATLVARLNARWSTAQALRAFADDIDDATGDLVAASLILGVQRRGPGLAAVLDDLAATVAEEVRIRRSIEADRAKPRATARWVTIITLGVLSLLSLNGKYIEPYRSGLGQLAFAVLLAAYVGCLIWMRRMTAGEATPRFLPATQTKR